MFATVEFFEKEKNIKNAVKRFFFGDEIISERVNLPENEYFYRLKVPVHKGRIPADKLKKIAGPMVDGLIFPESFVADKDIKVFSSDYFRDNLLFNSAISFIEKAMFNPTETLITLIDKRGVLHTEISRLLNCAGEVKVITDNIRAYGREADKIMSDYGLSVFVSDKLSAIPEKGIIISLCSGVVPIYFKGLLITGEKRLFPFAKVLVGEGIKAAGNYEYLCPEEINKTDFLAALCEVCFVKELRKSEYKKLVDISL